MYKSDCNPLEPRNFAGRKRPWMNMMYRKNHHQYHCQLFDVTNLPVTNHQKSLSGADNQFCCVEVAADLEAADERNIRDEESRLCLADGPQLRTPYPKRGYPYNILSRSSLHRYSTVASWVCLVDCTIFPILTFVIPLLGFANLGHDRLKFLHSLGDATTIYFLLPVGSLCTATNYYAGHRKPQIAALGAFGLVLVVLANWYSIPWLGHLQIFHCFHQGIWHRITSLSGCACLLGSNHLSHRHNHSSIHAKNEPCCVLQQNKSSRAWTTDTSKTSNRQRRHDVDGSRSRRNDRQTLKVLV